jgi:hypothetical protein
MNNYSKKFLAAALLVLMAALITNAREYLWQKPQATVTVTGAVLWKPEPFIDDLAGQDVRFIDYENGNDANDGRTRETPWKHHPWDYNATGNARAASGVKTYVFKRGVFYRGQLFADESGTKEQPVRLTSTATWGKGEAIFTGSVKLPAEWMKATSPEISIPNRLAEPEKVWAIDLKKTEWWNNGFPGYIAVEAVNYRNRRRSIEPPFIGLFTINRDGTATTNHLAQEPDWQPIGREFAHDYWPAFDGNSKPFTDEQGNEVLEYGAMDDALKGFPQDYFNGAIIWKTYPSLMGGATPTRPLQEKVVNQETGHSAFTYRPEDGALALTNNRGFSKGTRYKIENLPQHLDCDGELYLDKENVLFFRPSNNADPNDLHLELTINDGNIVIEDQSNIEISGLGFRYTDGTSIELRGSCESVNIHHCHFRDLMKYAIGNSLRPDKELWSEYRDPAEWKADWMNDIVVADNQLYNIWDMAIRFYDGRSYENWLLRQSKSWPWGQLGHIEVLRNRLEDIGIYHQGRPWASIPALSVIRAETGVVAGNIIKRSVGSGIMVQGGVTEGMKGAEVPLCRILVYNNSTEDTALGVNDYGGFSLWQSGVIYVYNNNIGNSVGYMPGGLFGTGRPINLSYPFYVDGGFKIVGFNNIVWSSTIDPAEPYRSQTAGYFSVFGFLNHFTNNTLFRHGEALGGSSGNRTDVISNVFADISQDFLMNNRVENPSLVGGGDTGASGIQGIPSLAYGRNFFHGNAVAGELVSSGRRGQIKVPLDVKAKTIDEMAKQMQSFPLRYGQLGEKLEDLPIAGEFYTHALKEEGATGADFRLKENSLAVDNGATYFMPWALARNVGEWNFTENRADPTKVVDYSFYMREVHFERFMYSWVPYNSIQFNEATLEDYVPAPSEDWVNGAMSFNGKRYGSVSDAAMREDVKIVINQYITGHDQRTWDRWMQMEGKEQWTIPEPAKGLNNEGVPLFGDDQTMAYAGERRKTLISKTDNLLLEVKFKTEPGNTGGYLMSKHDGSTGYRVYVDKKGYACFDISSNGTHYSVKTKSKVNDGHWHHVLAEIDRKTGRMTIYLNGKTEGEIMSGLPANVSIDNPSDFVVGKSGANDGGYLKGAIDFMRVCHGTLEDAKTSIGELYAWQFVNGPHLFDMRGEKAKGKRRDAGALELK